jgi:hypothetical protein
MIPTPHSPLLGAFCEPVISFVVPEQSYSLRYDLECLDRLRPLGFVEPVVLFCSRILEVLCRHAVSFVNRPADELAANLVFLRDNKLLFRGRWSWFNRLRWLGNDARHARRKLDISEADLAFLFMVRWLQWYFCEFKNGPKLVSVTATQQALDALLPTSWVHLLERLDQADLSAPEFLESLQLDERDSWILINPVAATVLIERLLDRAQYVPAQAILKAIKVRFSHDLRCKQLQALLWSNTGRLDDARLSLEHEERNRSTIDEETCGILAGVYKRLWKKSQNADWLRKCQQCYRKGWQRSSETNGYLGINAAYTALNLEQESVARSLAAEVGRMLEKRLQDFVTLRSGLALNYWDQVMLAEALLYEDPQRAAALYREAFAVFPEQKRNIKVSCVQAREILTKLGCNPEEYFFPGE